MDSVHNTSASSSRELGKKAKRDQEDSSGSDIERTRKKMTRFSSHPIDTSRTPDMPDLRLLAETAFSQDYLPPTGNTRQDAPSVAEPKGKEVAQADTIEELNIHKITVDKFNSAFSSLSARKGRMVKAAKGGELYRKERDAIDATRRKFQEFGKSVRGGTQEGYNKLMEIAQNPESTDDEKSVADRLMYAMTIDPSVEN